MKRIEDQKMEMELQFTNLVHDHKMKADEAKLKIKADEAKLDRSICVGFIFRGASLILEGYPMRCSGNLFKKYIV